MITLTFVIKENEAASLEAKQEGATQKEMYLAKVIADAIKDAVLKTLITNETDARKN